MKRLIDFIRRIRLSFVEASRASTCLVCGRQFEIKEIGRFFWIKEWDANYQEGVGWARGPAICNNDECQAITQKQNAIRTKGAILEAKLIK